MAAASAAQAVYDDPDQDRVLADLTAFFGPRADRFIALYEKARARPAKQRGNVLSWNWAVFFLSFVWFFYRKQYLIGALVLVLPIVLGVVVGGAGGGSMAAFALLANGLYLNAALSRIAKADALGLAGEERAEYLRRAGGVSKASGGVALALFALLLALVVASVTVKP
jgi:hypothetical protein